MIARVVHAALIVRLQISQVPGAQGDTAKATYPNCYFLLTRPVTYVTAQVSPPRPDQMDFRLKKSMWTGQHGVQEITGVEVSIGGPSACSPAGTEPGFPAACRVVWKLDREGAGLR